jgi:nucleotide-binding universal stress UspA family protein
MQVQGTVLFVSDLATTSDHALREAATLAASAGVPLTACHVLPEVIGIRPLFPQLHVLDRDRAREVSDWAAGQLEEQFQRALPPGIAPPDLRIESGSEPTTLIALAQEIGAGLVVVAADPAEPARGATLAEKLARHSSGPVLLVFPSRGSSVLAATDFSDPALPAIRAAQDEAARLALPLHVVHAVDPFVTMFAPYEPAMSQYSVALMDARREEARLLLDDLGRKLPGANLSLADGPAARVVLDTAERVDASLVVVGTHGRSGFSRLALGSVAERVLEGARRSTLVVPLPSRGAVRSSRET